MRFEARKESAARDVKWDHDDQLALKEVEELRQQIAEAEEPAQPG